jgi:hypothetical protein
VAVHDQRRRFRYGAPYRPHRVLMPAVDILDNRDAESVIDILDKVAAAYGAEMHNTGAPCGRCALRSEFVASLADAVREAVTARLETSYAGPDR